MLKARFERILIALPALGFLLVLAPANSTQAQPKPAGQAPLA